MTIESEINMYMSAFFILTLMFMFAILWLNMEKTTKVKKKDCDCGYDTCDSCCGPYYNDEYEGG